MESNIWNIDLYIWWTKKLVFPLCISYNVLSFAHAVQNKRSFQKSFYWRMRVWDFALIHEYHHEYQFWDRPQTGKNAFYESRSPAKKF